MSDYLKVIDAQTPVAQGYFSIVFRRCERVRSKVSLFRWVWLCLVEVIFGQELLESFVITASNSGCPEDQDCERQYGEPNQLNFHIPNGLFTNLFREHILQVLYYKFYLQYLFIEPVADPHSNHVKAIIDVTDIRFRFRKSLLYLVIPFRRVYLFSAVGFNVLADILAFAVTEDLTMAIVVGVVIEFIRRVFKL